MGKLWLVGPDLCVDQNFPVMGCFHPPLSLENLLTLLSVKLEKVSFSEREGGWSSGGHQLFPSSLVTEIQPSLVLLLQPGLSGHWLCTRPPLACGEAAGTPVS